MKKILFIALLMMMGAAGVKAQVENNDSLPETVEICKSKEGKTVSSFNVKIDKGTGDVSFVIEYDAKAGNLWQWCRMWLAENVKQYNQIKQIEDKAEGMLMVNLTLPLKIEGVHTGTGSMSRWIGTQTWKMTVKCKDERFRVQLTEYSTSWNSSALSKNFGWMDMVTRKNLNYEESVFYISTDSFATEYKKAVDFVINSLGEYIGKKAGDDDDF